MAECLHPRPIKLPDGHWIEVRCQKCLPCLGHRQAEWITRLTQEFKASPDGVYFVTLTYDEDHLPVKKVSSEESVPTIRSQDIIKFNMDLRKRFQQGFFLDDTLLRSGWSSRSSRIDLPSDVHYKYYITSEYGPETHRPHYHGFYSRLPEDEDLVFDLFSKTWGKGFVTCEKGQSEACASYVSKYLINDSLVPVDPRADRPRAWMSKGLGAMYLANYRLVNWHRSAPLDHLYVPSGSGKGVMPRYYRDKILDDSMRMDLQEFAASRADMKQKRLDQMSIEEFIAYRQDMQHREEENLRQAEWRFRKNGKIK